MTAAETELDVRSLLATETPAVAGILTTLVFIGFGDALLSDLENHFLTIAMFVWLFAVMMWGAFGVVRHADAVAEKLGEPYGTLVLTFSVIVIEVALLAAIMLHGQNNPTLARDVMFATLMIVLNGMVGTALLIGALRYWEQECNLTGARSFLVVMSALSIVALVLPKFTETAPSPVEAPGKAILFIAITVLFYAVFIFIQTMRHGAFFADPETRSEKNSSHQSRKPTRSLAYHVVMLVLTLVPVVALSEYLAVIVDFGIEDIGLPEPLGGLLIAVLVLAPEGLTAFHAALANHLQRAVNVCLGSALSTIGLTIPAVLIIGFAANIHVHLGLTDVETVLLVLTLFVSGLTFAGGRTNVLQGAVHLLLFFVYVALLFSP
ncbi:calcium:proton antiporter [Methyloceanibacter marginalis]|uniref:Calcium:proton antiporter n=1 Tax=Methyloceanibacter marginalis TaxID=1774971 RepID=A0A1E3W6U5_9HYPH|nr:calcium:proton antiporter [Methyloceanibacter marginalis]ODS01486.1 calcium:proton antiporter [Methyloceanibacter marginalis]